MGLFIPPARVASCSPILRSPAAQHHRPRVSNQMDFALGRQWKGKSPRYTHLSAEFISRFISTYSSTWASCQVSVSDRRRRFSLQRCRKVSGSLSGTSPSRAASSDICLLAQCMTRLVDMRSWVQFWLAGGSGSGLTSSTVTLACARLGRSKLSRGRRMYTSQSFRFILSVLRSL